MTYKRDVNDVRESPALEIIGELAAPGRHGPLPRPVRAPRSRSATRPWNRWRSTTRCWKAPTASLIPTDHSVVDYKRVVAAAAVVIDTRNATTGVADPHRKIVRL